MVIINFFYSFGSPQFTYGRYQHNFVYSIDFVPKTHHFPLIKKRKTHHFMACSVTRAACRDDVEEGVTDAVRRRDTRPLPLPSPFNNFYFDYSPFKWAALATWSGRFFPRDLHARSIYPLRPPPPPPIHVLPPVTLRHGFVERRVELFFGWQIRD